MMSGSLPKRTGSPVRVVAFAIMSSSTSSFAVTPSGMSSAQAPLSERKMMTVFSICPVSSSARTMRPMPWSMRSIWAA
jgi:hypothetical protein